MKRYNTKFLGFENVLKIFRQKSFHLIESTVGIGLPFSVETQIDAKYNLGRKDNYTRIVYVDVKFYDENYGL